MKLLFLTLFLFFSCSTKPAQENCEECRIVTDALGRRVKVPRNVDHILCSGAGALRYAAYLQLHGKVVGVDDAEKRTDPALNTRPYSIAYPDFAGLPLFGEFRGRENPELILSLDPAPQVIFKTYADMGSSVERLQEQTGIPVVALEYGDLMADREAMFTTLNMMGTITGHEARAREVTGFFEKECQKLQNMDVSSNGMPFLGGLSSRGTHGFLSTSPIYTPFELLGVPNVVHTGPQMMQNLRHTIVSEEKITQWDPEIIFLDLASTVNPESEGNALHELKTDPLLQELSAVRNSRIHTVIPHNSYTTNHGSVLANAYYIASVLGNEDIDVRKKADEIYSFLVGKPVFQDINAVFDEEAFRRIHVSY
ncbi:MAG: ABC transporter substrate-binding protein [Fibrobacterota bacterium]